MADGPVFTSFPFILRFLEMITSIIAFAVVVEFQGSTKINYIMFTGITGFVLAFFFMVLYAAGAKWARGKLAAVIDGLWWVFWLAAAAVSTNVLTMQGWSINQTRASCAFCWISWVLWTLSLLISLREVRGFEYA